MNIPNINNNFPHICLGKEGFSMNNQPKPNKQENNPNLNTQNTNSGGSNDDKGYELYEKIRKWAFIGILCIVMGYAGCRIILSIFGI